MFKSDRQDLPAVDKQGGLKGVRIFSELAPKELALLASECHWREFSRGDIIVSAGQGPVAHDVWFVISGAVRIARSTGLDGRIAYSDVEAGGQFGEMSLFGVDNSELTAIAREACSLALMPESVFVELLGREESVSRGLLCQYATLLRQQDAMSAAASTNLPGTTGSQRVYAELLALGEPRTAIGGSMPGLFVARLPRHRELADRVGTTEEVVAGAIAELIRLELAVREYPGLLILDEGAVARLCKGV